MAGRLMGEPGAVSRWKFHGVPARITRGWADDGFGRSNEIALKREKSPIQVRMPPPAGVVARVGRQAAEFACTCSSSHRSRPLAGSPPRCFPRAGASPLRPAFGRTAPCTRRFRRSPEQAWGRLWRSASGASSSSPAPGRGASVADPGPWLPAGEGPRPRCGRRSADPEGDSRATHPVTRTTTRATSQDIQEKASRVGRGGSLLGPL